jgi:hypothetical protein
VKHTWYAGVDTKVSTNRIPGQFGFAKRHIFSPIRRQPWRVTVCMRKLWITISFSVSPSSECTAGALVLQTCRPSQRRSKRGCTEAPGTQASSGSGSGTSKDKLPWSCVDRMTTSLEHELLPVWRSITQVRQLAACIRHISLSPPCCITACVLRTEYSSAKLKVHRTKHKCAMSLAYWQILMTCSEIMDQGRDDDMV